MVESEVPVDATLLPETPEGYASPREFHYPTAFLLLGSVVLSVAAAVVFGGLLWAIQGPRILDAALHVREGPDGVAFTVDLPVVLAALVSSLAATVVHESIHGLVYRRLGYRVSYGVEPRLGAFYAAAFHQYQTRGDNLRVALAPRVVLTVLLTPLLAVPVPLVAVGACCALIVNTGGAVGDVYAAWRIDRLPEGTLLYDGDIRHFYVFEPLDP